MTRTEMQVLREDVAAGLNHLALLRIDAELAKPEEREWGTRYIGSDATDGDMTGGYARTEEQARKLVMESPRQWALVSRVAESRTQHGPWERAK